MSWIDRLSDQQRKEVSWSRMYARDYGHFTDGHSRLMLVSLLAELLDQLSGELQLARLHAIDDRPPIEALIAAARAAGAEGTWIVRGAAYAALHHGWSSVGGPALELERRRWESSCSSASRRGTAARAGSSFTDRQRNKETGRGRVRETPPRPPGAGVLAPAPQSRV